MCCKLDKGYASLLFAGKNLKKIFESINKFSRSKAGEKGFLTMWREAGFERFAGKAQKRFEIISGRKN